MTYLDIGNLRIRSFEELVNIFETSESKNPDESLYEKLIACAADSDLSIFLEDIGEIKLAERVRALDYFGQTDSQIMSELQEIITNGTVKIIVDPFEYVQVLGTSVNVNSDENIVQAKFEIQVLKVAKENISFCIVSDENRSEKRLSLDNYRKGEIVTVTLDLNKIDGDIVLYIGDREVMRKSSRVTIGDILCSDNTTVPCSEWPVEGKTAKGVVFHVDDSGYHGWAVHLKDQGNFVWATEGNQKLVPDLSECNSEKLALADMDGYANTTKICSKTSTPPTSTTTNSSKGDLQGHTPTPSTTALMGAFAALMVAGIVASTIFPKSSSLSGKPTKPTCCYPAASAVDFANGWFLPACGQLKTLIDRKNKVNDSLKKTGGDIVSNSEYWSSSQKDKDHAWSVYGSEKVCFHKKDFYCRVRAIRTF